MPAWTRAALVTAPSGALANAFAEVVAEPEATTGVVALVGAVLPALDGVYRAHLGSASPVSEASVLEVLTGARRELVAEIRGGRALVEGLPEGWPLGGDLAVQFERAFAETDVFPGVRPS